MRDFIREFLDAKAVEDGVALNTLQAYRRDISQFVDSVAPASVKKVQSGDIEMYLKRLKDAGYCAKTLSRKISCIREFYKFLQSEKIVSDSPANKLRVPKIGKPLPLFLTPKEVEKLCNAARTGKTYGLRRMEVMVKLMYTSGLRVSELVSLPENALNYDKHQILISGKGGKERIVPVSQEVIKEILTYTKWRDEFVGNRKNCWMFPSLRSLSGHITRDGFFKSLKKLAIKAKIPPDKVHPHVLRHSFATKLVNNNVDLRSIQKMLGHENIVTTEIYTHITTEKLVNEVKKRHPLTSKDNNAPENEKN